MHTLDAQPRTSPVPTDEPATSGGIAELRAVYVGSPAQRRARLQGWRGDDLLAVLRAGPMGRLAPAFCGVATLVAVVTSSIPLVLVILATALVGMVAPNHPVETLANVVARRTGRPTLPPNRAAKRLGCAIGSLHLAGGAVALALGATVVAQALLVSLGGLAMFVAVSGICVPSILYTLAFGARRATAARLFG